MKFANGHSGIALKLVSSALLIHYASYGFAGSNKAYGVSTRPESMGGAFVAVADDASAIYYNPAGLTQIRDKGMIFDLGAIMPHSVYTNAFNGIAVHNRQPAASLGNFFSKRMSDKMAVGVGVYAPFARSTKYPASAALYGQRFRSLVADVNLATVVALQTSDKLSFGMGPIINFDIVNVEAFGFKQNANGFGVSGVFSTLYALNQAVKLGATFHLPSSMNIRGRGRLPGLIDSRFSVKYRNPAYLDAGISIKPTPNLVIAVDAGTEFWQQAKDTRYFYANPSFDNKLVFNPKNSYNGHVGLEYYFKPEQALRLGYAYFQRAMPAEGLVPGALDFGANLFSIGYTYIYQQKWQIHAGYEYATSQDVISTQPLYNPFVGRYHARVNTVLLGINYQT